MPKSENQEKSSKKPGLLHKIGNFLKKSASALGGAALGGAIGSVIPGLGTLVGAMLGAVIGRTIEAGADYALGINEEPLSTAQPEIQTVGTNSEAVRSDTGSTASMIQQMGGTSQDAARAAAEPAETPVLTPKAATNPLQNAFWEKQSGPAVTTSPLSNPAALPRLTRSAAAAA